MSAVDSNFKSPQMGQCLRRNSKLGEGGRNRVHPRGNGRLSRWKRSSVVASGGEDSLNLIRKRHRHHRIHLFPDRCNPCLTQVAGPPASRVSKRAENKNCLTSHRNLYTVWNTVTGIRIATQGPSPAVELENRGEQNV